MTDDKVGYERAPVADNLRISSSELDGGQKETGTDDKGDSVRAVESRYCPKMARVPRRAGGDTAVGPDRQVIFPSVGVPEKTHQDGMEIEIYLYNIDIAATGHMKV